MKSEIRTFQLMALLSVAMVTWSMSAALPPDEDDVTVIGYEGAPACELYDGIILLSNASSEWDYKVAVWAYARNDKYGNASCDVDCTEHLCECSLSGVFVAYAEDDAVAKKACGFSKCLVACGPHCDNTSCDPVGHCTCVEGTYSVTHYKETQVGDWISMGITATLDITETEQNEECPAGDRCD